MWPRSLEPEESVQCGETGIIIGVVMQPRRTQDHCEFRRFPIGHQRRWLSECDADSDLEPDVPVLSADLVHGPLGSGNHRGDPIEQEPPWHLAQRHRRIPSELLDRSSSQRSVAGAVRLAIWKSDEDSWPSTAPRTVCR